MTRERYWNLSKAVAGLLVTVTVLNVFGGWVSWNDIVSLKDSAEEAIKPREAKAVAQYTATSDALIVGTEMPRTGPSAASGNTGGWQGTLASDNFRWTVSSTVSGLDQQLNIDGSDINGANKFIVVMEAAASNTTLQRLYQICDWTSSSEVDNAADAQCTTGGWRTMNIRDTAITSATETAYTWHIYDGYWNQAATPNTSLSTPLTNFIRSSDGRILLRSYAPTNCTTCTHTLDYARVDTVIDPIYMPSGATNLGSGAFTGNYRDATNALFTGQSGSDNNRIQVAGTAGTVPDFYFNFENVETYTGANTILMRAEYSCSVTNTGIDHRPRIWNFNSSAWEDLTSTSIDCSTTEVTNAFAKNNVTISDYVSGGQVRIAWHGLNNGTHTLRIDQIYIILGSTNTDSAKCEISFGTGTATDCTNTRTLDTTAALSTWTQTAATESAAFGNDFYGQDNDGDATNSERGTSANLWLPVTVDNPARITALVYSMNFRSNVTTMTAVGQFKDFGGANLTVSGGWTNFGTTNALTTYTYEDSVTNGYFLSNPDDYINPETGELNVRVRTSVSTNTTTNTVRDIDFVFASVQWVETTPTRYTLKVNNVATGDQLVVGTEAPRTGPSAASGNTGGWQGTLASDNFTWAASSTTSGLDQQLQFDGAKLNGANKFVVIVEASTNNTTLSRFYQICDWVSTTEVDAAADAQCTGGGWRNMNIRDVGLTATADTAYTWHIYDGYWNQAATPNTSLSTPLSNFISTSTERILVRAFSSTNCTTCLHSIDRATIMPVIDPIYTPSGMTTTTAITVTGDYRNTTNAIFTGQSGSDDTRLQVAGNATTTADFYMSFKNIETYSTMNSILVRAEYSCSATGINHRPKIWNFTGSAWEDLTATSIACATGDAINAFAKSNVNVNDYISNGEIRIGWRGLSNGTQAIRIDMIYVMLGSVNSNSALCEISFGTGTATDCTNTRTLDTTAALSTWTQTAATESAAFGNDFYGQDNDGDATNSERGTSANLSVSSTIPMNAQLVGRAYAVNFRSNVTTMTAQPQFQDLSGQNATVSGGWTNFATANALTTYTYSDAVTNGYFASNAEDYIDTYTGTVNVRFRTSASTNTTTNTVRDIDFVFASVQWVEPPQAPSGEVSLMIDNGEPEETDLRFRFRLDEGIGPVINDDSINLDAAGLSGSATWLPTASCKRGYSCVSFDGIDDYATLGFTGLGDLPFTMAAWVRTSSTSGYIFGNNDTSDLKINGGKLELRIAGGGTFTATSTTSINDGQWHHVVATRAASKLYIYVDGVLENTVSSGLSGPDIGVDAFAAQTISGTSPTEVDIDEAIFFLRKLGDDEVLQLANSGISLGNLTPGTPIMATSSVSIFATSTTSGYQLTVNRDSATSTLVHRTNGSAFAEYTSWDPLANSGNGNATTTGVVGSTLSFRLASSTASFNSTWWGSGTPIFAGFPTTTKAIMNCTGCANGGTSSTVSYRVNAPPTQAQGFYSGSLTFTVLANP